MGTITQAECSECGYEVRLFTGLGYVRVAACGYVSGARKW